VLWIVLSNVKAVNEMRNEPDITKYAELQAKTDGQLLAIIAGALDHARRATGNRAEVARECARAQALLPLVYHLSSPERLRLESRLAEFRRALVQAA
jgi:uncharacterized protein YbjT (DUF2867 family)